MDAEVLKTRNEIVRKFCRTIVWIDDGINLQEGLKVRKPQDSPLFWEKLKEFSAAGLLCHLQGFPQVEDSEGDDPFSSEVGNEVEKCAKLALQSDIVIVDWMLGSVDSSKYAQEIVKRLLGDKQGFRFIVILSQKPPERGFPGILDSTFTSIGGTSIAGVEGLWKNKTGQFLLSLRKDDFAHTSLFDCICKALQKVYPDYLHLAALEIAGRIKSFVPQWLSNMPFRTDIGILVERGNTRGAESWNAELQECIVSNLMEDLATVSLDDDLKAISPSMLQSADCCAAQAVQCFDTSDDNLKTALEALNVCIGDDVPVCNDVDKIKKFTKANFIALASNIHDNRIKAVVEGIESYAEFCEKRSASEFKSNKVCPGATYEGLTDDNTAISVCITAGCDCVRKNAFLFLVGTPIPLKVVSGTQVPDYGKVRHMDGGKTVLRMNKREYVFKSEAESMVVKTRTDIQAAKMIGIVRQDILNRLIGRYMSHTQRYGVNLPDIVRRLREETDFDEKK